jgi:hypothetical protein
MPALTPGQLAKVDLHGRVTVPLDVLKSVAWWTGETVRVTAELTRRGLVRLYPNSAVGRKTASANGAPHSDSAYIIEAVRVDRYRELSLYNDCRLRLTKEVCVWLGFSLGDKRDLYAQSCEHFLEVMSMEHRFERLHDAEDDMISWPFVP